MKFPKLSWLIVILVFLEQITKVFFIGKNIVIFEYFSFNYVTNTGVSFGLFKGYNLFFIFMTLIVIIFILSLYDKDKKYQMSFNFILAGAIGNLFDRVFRGYVIDFIDLKFWPVFNLADTFIIIGVVLFLYYLWKENK